MSTGKINTKTPNRVFWFEYPNGETFSLTQNRAELEYIEDAKLWLVEENGIILAANQGNLTEDVRRKWNLKSQLHK